MTRGNKKTGRKKENKKKKKKYMTPPTPRLISYSILRDRVIKINEYFLIFVLKLFF